MNIIPRIAITDAMVVSTNVTDTADYDESNSYSIGELAVDPATHLEYESLTNSNLGNAPADSPSDWLLVGYANSWRMIDSYVSGQTENATSVELVLEIGQLFTSVAVFNVSGASVSISIVEDSEEIYTETVSLVRTDDVENIWDYLFTEPEFKTSHVFASVPGFAGATVTLTINAPGSTAKIGEAIFGYGRNIGHTVAGSGTRIKDNSTKEANAFGEYTIVERPYSRGANMVVAINPEDNDRITRIFEENRAKICVFYPDADMERYGLTVIGFYQEYEPSLSSRGLNIVEIPIEGIT